MTAVLFAVNAVLAVAVAVLAAAYMFLRRQVEKEPTVRHQVHAMKRDTAEWAVPYSELEFGRELGKGSQGEVFAAQMRGTEVAVKRVDTSQVDPEVIEEFQQECAILSRIRHPNVTLFMGVAVQYPYVAICTELVHRGSLFHLLRDKTQPLPWPRALRLALDIAQGMQYLHEYSPAIIHRDLKSLNILVTNSWRAKVADFGMTRFRNEGTMTQCGSPLWMAPEMIKNVAYDHRSDVYSFGIMMWELYTRKIPYRGTGLKPGKLVVKVVKEGLRPVLPIQCPLQYVRLVKACWHADPERRPSFAKIVRTIQGFLKDEELLRHVPTSSNRRGSVVSPQAGPGEAGEAGAAGGGGGGGGGKAKRSGSPRGAWKVDYKKEVVIGEVIGRGSSATVFDGKFRGKDVAVKRWAINTDVAATRRQIDKKISSIMDGISDLRHPNLTLFMGAFFEPSHVGMITEKMDRGSLDGVLHNHDVQLMWDTIMTFMIDAAQGMAYLHGHDPPILHGDLKSTRLLVSQSWRVKVSGYGIVDFKSTIQSVPRSAYTAPEVLRSPSKGTAKSNVYSFGVVMWEMLTRERPFGGVEFTRAQCDQVVGGMRPDIPGHVPDKFRELIRRCWKADPKRRPSFEHVVEVLQDLKREGPPSVSVNAGNAGRYRKARIVHAYVSKDPVTVDKDWGRNRGKSGCYVVISGDDDVYLSDAQVFETTYEKVPGREHEYRKTGVVLARRMDTPFALKSKDGVQNGGQGDYVVENEAGEQWVVAGPTFEELYEPCSVADAASAGAA